MSDYEVSLVNDSMQEFYVRFYGPAESTLLVLSHPPYVLTVLALASSTVCWGSVEDPCRTSRSISIQVTQYWLYEQDLPP
jgi:hypothetical protein